MRRLGRFSLMADELDVRRKSDSGRNTSPACRTLRHEPLEERRMLDAVPLPSGLVSLWPADNTPDDVTTQNGGVLLNDAGVALIASRQSEAQDGRAAECSITCRSRDGFSRACTASQIVAGSGQPSVRRSSSSAAKDDLNRSGAAPCPVTA